MVIPVLGPGVGIGIDMHQEEMMQEPDMSVEVGIQRVVMFEALKEDFPLVGKAGIGVDPHSFNASVMDRSEKTVWVSIEGDGWERKLTGPRYMNRGKLRNNSPSIGRRIGSQDRNHLRYDWVLPTAGWYRGRAEGH